MSQIFLPTGTQVLSPTAQYRSDTFTVAASGTTVSTLPYAVSSHSIVVKCTTAAATAWDVRLEGSLDGTNFTTLLTHTNTTGDGVILASGATLTPCLYFRSRCASVTLGGATNLIATIVGI